MSDSIVLNGPNGSSIQLASYILADPGPDFGEADLLKAAYSENPAAEGGVLAFETVNIRRMSFPMRLASSSTFTTAQAAGWLRTLARPGATLDVQLDGVPSAESIRFDVAAGRFEPGIWDTFKFSQTDRFDGTLKLDVQPFGYWPTMILLASAASIGGPGVLGLNLGGSIFGDVPGLAEILVVPTSATGYGGASQRTDSLYWSLGAQASFQAFWPAASALPSIFTPAATLTNPTLIGDKYAPGSQALYMTVWTPSKAGGAIGNTLTAWSEMTEWVVPPSLEPGYRGRHRAYAWVRWDTPSFAPIQFLQLSLDAQPGTYGAALASIAPVATVQQSLASNSAVAGFGPSPAYSLVDLGEVTLPLVASQQLEARLRLWANPATTNLGYATTASAGLFIGGLYLQPLDGGAGVLPRGLNQPTNYTGGAVGSFYTGAAFLSAVTRDVTIESPTTSVASRLPQRAAAAYRGVLPVVGASSLQLDLNLGGRDIGGGVVPTWEGALRSEPHFAQVSVRYRPRFTFLKGI